MIGKLEILRTISTSPSGPVRFAVEIDGVRCKLLSYFPIGADTASDSSIALHTYFRSTHTYEKRIDKPPSELSPEEKPIRLSAYEAEAREFHVHKFSFHQTGVLTTKDKKGRRISDDPDARSICFESIPDWIRCCDIYPVRYSRYPVGDPAESKLYNIIVLPKESEEIPPIIHIRISKKKPPYI